MLNQAHPIIGIVLFVLLFFQPLLGFLHHFMFKKHGRRMVWSYGHIWLGRIIITLGIINGGLGLQLAKRTRTLSHKEERDINRNANVEAGRHHNRKPIGSRYG